jgi:hypothetical protein
VGLEETSIPVSGPLDPLALSSLGVNSLFILWSATCALADTNNDQGSVLNILKLCFTSHLAGIDVCGHNIENDEVIISEIESLQSLLDQTIKFEKINLKNNKNGCYVITLELEDIHESKIILDVYILDNMEYPTNTPIVLMRNNKDQINNELLLFIQLKLHGKLNELKNDCMIYEIVFYLRDNIKTFLDYSNISTIIISDELFPFMKKMMFDTGMLLSIDPSTESTYESAACTDPVMNIDNSSKIETVFNGMKLTNDVDDDNSDFNDQTTQESSSNNISIKYHRDQNSTVFKNQNYMTDDDAMSILSSSTNNNMKKEKKFMRQSFWSRLSDNHKTSGDKPTELYLKMLKERKNLPAWGSRLLCRYDVLCINIDV